MDPLFGSSQGSAFEAPAVAPASSPGVQDAPGNVRLAEVEEAKLLELLPAPELGGFADGGLGSGCIVYVSVYIYIHIDIDLSIYPSIYTYACTYV